MPSASFRGELGHATLEDQAVAYLFHLVKSHPFVDGNKRTGLVSMLVVLGLNARRLDAAADELTDLVLGVAEGRLGKADIAVFVHAHVRRRRP